MTKQTCRMCGHKQDIDDLEEIEGLFYCQYPYNSSYIYDVKSCSEKARQYIRQRDKQ